MLRQVNSAGERGSVPVARARKTKAHSASNNFLECCTLLSSWSDWVRSVLAVELLSQPPVLWEAEGVSMRCGGAPGSADSSSNGIHRSYIYPRSGLNSKTFLVRCAAGLKLSLNLKHDFISAPAYQGCAEHAHFREGLSLLDRCDLLKFSSHL